MENYFLQAEIAQAEREINSLFGQFNAAQTVSARFMWARKLENKLAFCRQLYRQIENDRQTPAEEY